MTLRFARLAAAMVLLLGTQLVWAGSGDLNEVYASILRGDYRAARSTVDELASGSAGTRVREVSAWLDDYHKVIANREELKAQTYEWNVSEARKALEDGEVYLALNFVSQAVPYAESTEKLLACPFVQELTRKARLEALQLERADKWTKALAYYLHLNRIYEDNEEIEELKERATRFARIEVTYEDRDAMEERIQGVDREVFRGAARMIGHLYFKSPDFKHMALGALDNISTLCQVDEMQDYLDGLANPALRRHFLQKIDGLRQEIDRTYVYDRDDLLRLFNQIAAINMESVELPEALLVVEFMEGVVEELDDYTGVIWPADAKEFDKIMRGGFEGVGIQLGIDERSNRLKVISPLEGSPALEAGIQPGDLIVAVDGESTDGWDTDDAVKNIMGPARSEVVLTMFRPSTGETLSFPLTRRRIVLTTVRGIERREDNPDQWNYMLDNEAGVAYIRLTGFHPDSARELRAALNEARREGMRGLILDVRHNPGGLLDVAIDVVSAFLERGDVVSTRGRQESERRERVDGGATYRDLPLVVLVNEGSASASEILAGALQDHHRAVVLGERTFGKGSVQHVRALDDMGMARLKVTTALYYLPSGRTPHKADGAKEWGVDPDWKLMLTPKEFRKVIEREREANIIHNEAQLEKGKKLSEEEQEKLLAELKSENEEDEEPLLSENDIERLEADPHDAPDVDPQLETALLLVRVKLAANVPWPAELAAALEE